MVLACILFISISPVSTRSLPFLSFIVPIFGQNVPLIFPVFLKRCLVFFLLLFSSSFCTVHWRRPSFLSVLFFGTLRLVGCTFPFLPCFSFLFFLQLFVKPPQITTLPSCFSFSLGWFCLLSPVQYYGPLSVGLQAHCELDLMPWVLFVTSTAYSQGSWLKSYLACLVVIPTFFSLSLNFNMRSLIWATVSSMSCFCWLYTASPSLATKNVISLILTLTI